MSTINEDLLAAAKCVYSQIGNVAPAHIRHVVTPNQRDNLRDAIAAAERELAERKLPIDEEWLDAKCEHMRNGNHWELFDIMVHRDGDGEHFAVIGNTRRVVLTSQGQLLDLLSGLGIEVKK